MAQAGSGTAADERGNRNNLLSLRLNLIYRRFGPDLPVHRVYREHWQSKVVLVSRFLSLRVEYRDRGFTFRLSPVSRPFSPFSNFVFGMCNSRAVISRLISSIYAVVAVGILRMSGQETGRPNVGHPLQRRTRYRAAQVLSQS